ncbi:MAG: Lrp/AsnC ligand binding domain-containing protein [Methanobacteriaceae archaeon]|jgi:DNA-binding Lrp family transcriptional regulator
MVMGCVLIKLMSGMDKKAFSTIKKLESKGTYALFGEYDALMMVEAEDIKKLTSFVVDNIRSIEGVESTRTMICAEI